MLAARAARPNRFGTSRIVRETVAHAMIRYRFGSDDLLRTRFALSPLFEIVWSAHVLRRPARAPLHRPWVAAARARLPGLDCAMLDWPPDSLGGGGHVAGLLTPPPGAPPGAPP